MATLFGTGLAPFRLRDVVARWQRRPTWLIELAIFVSWAVLAWWSLATTSPATGGQSMPMKMSMGSMPGMNMGSMPGMNMGSMPGMHPAAHSAADHALIGLPMLLVASVAMMLPGSLPALKHVATHSFRWRRGRALAQFLLIYLAVWVLFGALALTLLGQLRLSPRTELLASLAIAAGWQLTSLKRRAVRDCHRSVPLPPSGWPAVVGVCRFASVNANACVRSCWAMMLTMAVVPPAEMVVCMPLLTGMISAEKVGRRPRLATRVVAVGLAVGAGIALLA